VEYESNWEYTKSQSSYHFDKWRTDAPEYAYQRLGRFVGDWQGEVETAVERSRRVCWETRQYNNDGRASPMIREEEYDLERAGADPKMTIYRLYQGVASLPVIASMSRIFAMGNTTCRLHVQFPGEVLTRHIDKLSKVQPEDPANVKRFIVMLQDWEPGQFFMYGNAMFSHWRAGDIVTFDWPNMPHCTANASLVPRALLVVTGQMSAATRAFIREGVAQRLIPLEARELACSS
jgi:hypothetical protein